MEKGFEFRGLKGVWGMGLGSLFFETNISIGLDDSQKMANHTGPKRKENAQQSPKPVAKYHSKHQPRIGHQLSLP